MTLTVAIHPDDETNPALGPGHPDASSPIWERCLINAGHRVRHVNVFSPDIIGQLDRCHGLMWRRLHNARHHAVARRLLPVAEDQLGLCVYPDRKTAWHYDDKIAQDYLLKAAGIPVPDTWVFYDREEAECFCHDSEYPLVLKLAAGAGSSNVRLLHDADEAMLWIEQLFGAGLRSLAALPEFSPRDAIKRVHDAARFTATGEWPNPGSAFELHKNYLLVQRFLPDNAFDTRVSVVGGRAFAYRRFNRPNDFRASGSGNFDPDPNPIDPAAVHLALDLAERLGTQSVAVDCLRDPANGGRFVIGEISYTYVSWMVHACPGHWTRRDGQLEWQPGQMYPEEAQAADFIQRLEQTHVHDLQPMDPKRRAA